MKSSYIFLLFAFVGLAHADPIPKEDDNYQKVLRDLYNWTQTEFKPYALPLVNLTYQMGRNTNEDPRLFEGQDHSVIQSLVDRTNTVLNKFVEAIKHADSEDFMEKAMHAFEVAANFKWKEGLPESVADHVTAIKEERFKKFTEDVEAIFVRPSKEFFDKFLARIDETINKLTPSEQEAHPALTRWYETRKNAEWNKTLYFNEPWEFLDWAHDELNGTDSTED